MDQIESIGPCSNIQKAAVIFFIRLVDCNVTFSVIILCGNIAFISPNFSNFPACRFIIPSIFTEAEGGVQPVSGRATQEWVLPKKQSDRKTTGKMSTLTCHHLSGHHSARLCSQALDGSGAPGTPGGPGIK